MNICLQEDEFGRKPTPEEVEYARFNAFEGLAERTRQRQTQEKLTAGNVTFQAESKKQASKKGKCKLPTSGQCRRLSSTEKSKAGQRKGKFQLVDDEEESADDVESETDADKEDDGSGSSSGSSSSEDEGADGACN